MDLVSVLIIGIGLLIVLTVHEAAHAWMANYLGDPTARLMGRLSLNPLVHLDLVGTIVFITTALVGFPFGWGKPVLFDPYNLKKPKRDAALISLAGPVSNLIFAGAISLIARIFPIGIFEPLIVLNISLAIFNLVPIHPLDGGKILMGILPYEEAKQYEIFLNKYGIFILLLLILPIVNGQSMISIVIFPVVRFLASVFVP